MIRSTPARLKAQGYPHWYSLNSRCKPCSTRDAYACQKVNFDFRLLFRPSGIDVAEGQQQALSGSPSTSESGGCAATALSNARGRPAAAPASLRRRAALPGLSRQAPVRFA
eukprot:220977-Pleurochrysis_carterae.AAC.1